MGHRTELDITLGTGEGSCRVAQVEAIAIASLRMVILGRQVLFESLRVEFDVSADEIQVDPVSPAEA